MLMMMSSNTIINNNNDGVDDDYDDQHHHQSSDEDKLDEKEDDKFDLFNSLGKLKIVSSEELFINKTKTMRSSLESLSPPSSPSPSPSSSFLLSSACSSSDTTTATAKTTMMMMMMCLQNNTNNNNNNNNRNDNEIHNIMKTPIDFYEDETINHNSNNRNPFQLMPNYLLNSNVDADNVKDLFGQNCKSTTACNKCSSLFKRHYHHNYNHNKFNNNNNVNNFNYNKNKLFDMEHKIYQPTNLFKKRSTKHRKILKEPVLTLIENCMHQQNQSTYKYFETNTNNLNLLSQFNLNKIGYKATVAEYARLTLTTSPSALITTLTPSSQSYNLYKINNCLKLEHQQHPHPHSHSHHHRQLNIDKQINVIKFNDDNDNRLTSYAIKPSFMRNKTTTTLTTTMATSYSLSPLSCNTTEYGISPHSSSNLCTSTPSTTLSLSSSSGSSSSLMSFAVGTSSSNNTSYNNNNNNNGNNNSNNNNNSCSQQARLNETNCDVTIDELACYFETLVHIPKKMSTMAEMMYI